MALTGRAAASLILLAAVVSLRPADAGAHAGGLNKDGCHHDRKQGGEHCHRGPAATEAVRRQPLMSPAADASVPARAQVFRNCAEARAAGAAPVRRGELGYGVHLDRDHDGVGCEPSRGR
ncbi:MAG: excalibur calcium-binding domain-containing protein [Pseudoxanthomonas sp.]